MKKILVFLTVAFTCGGFSNVALAGIPSDPPQFLGGRHHLFFNAGMLMNTATVAGVSTSGVGVSTGFIGGLGYGYWFNDEWSLNFSASIFSPEANLNRQGASTSAVVPIQFGLRYYPSSLMLGSVGRPFIGASAGSYFQFGAGTGGTVVGTSSQAVLGAQFTAGVDIFASGWLRFGPSISYHAVGEFTNARRNYSGAEFSLNIGFFF
ncbi:MAG: hypothetical protein HY22_06040 [[Candidatus Thermochlorobacteriaceae] bacterium GBChlB]|nr:MAG: hypothetical protein HY22_06040 [[Candidatus Thermochlorobacteriaceae] bacterium GBChlB]